MKSQFARIKNRARSVSARTLALVLCFVMLVTAVSAGAVIDSSLDVTGYGDAGSAVADGIDKIADIADDSADNDNSIAEEGFFPAVKNRIKDLALTGGKVDLAETRSSSNVPQIYGNLVSAWDGNTFNDTTYALTDGGYDYFYYDLNSARFSEFRISVQAVPHCLYCFNYILCKKQIRLYKSRSILFHILLGKKD